MFEKIYLLFKKIKFAREFILISFVIIILLYPVLLHPYYTFFPFSDVNIYSSWKIFLTESIKIWGVIPLWNPYLFGGTPFIGNSQVGFFYPVNILYFIFPVSSTFGYVFVLDTILTAIFTFAYARLIKLSKFSALMASFIFIFNGSVISQVFLGHIVILDSFVWFPLLLYFFEKIAQSKKIFYSVFLGIIFGIMILAGNAQIPLYAFLAATFYFYIRIFWKNTENTRSRLIFLLIPVIAMGIGLLISAIQIIPTLEFSKLSIRNAGISYQFASDFSFHPKQFLVFLFPSLFGSDINNSYWGIGSFWATIIYTGIAPFYFFLIGVLKKRNKYFYVFLILLIFSILYSLGRYSFLFKIFYDYIPFFNNFRVPTRMLFISAFSFSIISGLGINYLEEMFKKKKNLFLTSFSKLLLILTVGSALILTVLFLNRDNISLFEKIILKNSYALGIDHKSLYYLIINDVSVFCFFSLLTLTTFILMLKNKINRNIFFIFLSVIVIFDYFLFYSKFIKPATTNISYSNELNFIKSDKTRFRIYSQPAIPANITSDNKIESLSGYDPLFLLSYRDFMWKIGPHENSPYESSITINKVKNTNNLKLLNVKYVLSKNRIERSDLKEVFKGTYYVYTLSGFLPRAYLFFGDKPDFLPGENIQEVKIKDYQPNSILLSFDSKTKGFLILSELKFPGWSAYDNNTKVNITSSNKIFRAIPIKPGHHEVLFKYEPVSYKIGKTITVATLIVIIFTLFYLYKREK